jgi:hypothetical protein
LILALDPSSTATGYAIHDGRTFIEKGVLRPDTGKEKCPCRRAYQMGREVQTIIDEHADRLTLILVENPPPTQRKKRSNPGAQHQAFGLIMGVVIGSKVPYRTIHPSTWTRNRPKELWSQDIRRRHKLPAGKDKGADACAAIGMTEWWAMVGRHRFEVSKTVRR